MNKEELKEMAKNPNLIEGIYNYCDRWCERCEFTTRCLNYEMGEKQFDDPESRDMNNKKFWEKLSETFQLTFEMIKETADEMGIDLNAADDEELIKEHKRIEKEAKDHHLSRTALKYADTVRNWFEKSEELFKQKDEELNRKLNCSLPGTNPGIEAVNIRDSMEIISWYQYQIYVKLRRAFSGKLEGDEDPDYPKDSDGSAKVALIGIDRSIASWGRIMKHFPDKKDEILDFLITLDRLRKQAEKEFPDARAFVRAGFDTIEK